MWQTQASHARQYGHLTLHLSLKTRGAHRTEAVHQPLHDGESEAVVAVHPRLISAEQMPFLRRCAYETPHRGQSYHPHRLISGRLHLASSAVAFGPKFSKKIDQDSERID